MTSPLKGKPANRGKRVSAKEFAAMWGDPTISLREIAERIGVTSTTAVWQRAKSRGLPNRRDTKTTAAQRKVSREQEPLFTAMYRANVSTAEMARYFGVQSCMIARIADRSGVQHRGFLSASKSITVAQFQESLILASMARTAARETKRARAEGILFRSAPAPHVPKPLLLEHRIGA